jgi:hypothetical protein
MIEEDIYIVQGLHFLASEMGAADQVGLGNEVKVNLLKMTPE